MLPSMVGGACSSASARARSAATSSSMLSSGGGGRISCARAPPPARLSKLTSENAAAAFMFTSIGDLTREEPDGRSLPHLHRPAGDGLGAVELGEAEALHAAEDAAGEGAAALAVDLDRRHLAGATHHEVERDVRQARRAV